MAVLARVAEIEVEQDNSESTRIVKVIESYSSKVTLPESESYLDVETDNVVAQVKRFNKINGFITIFNTASHLIFIFMLMINNFDVQQ